MLNTMKEKALILFLECVDIGNDKKTFLYV